MKILIDARLYGLENAGLGRYVMNLIKEICLLDSKNEYVFLLRKKYFETLDVPENCKKILADFRHYSFSEQISLTNLFKNIKPDLVHFPHFNVPIFFKGKYIVTIHDLLMHKQVGLKATTLPPFFYFIKRLGYKFVFRNAVLNARQIIVPTNVVKKEIEDYYQVQSDKIKVVYEGFDEDSFNKVVRSQDISKYDLQGQYFVYTGNAYPHKNLDRLVEAIASLNKGRGEFVNLAVVTSRNIFTKRLENTVKTFKAEKYVKILGFVPDSDMAAIYQKSVGLVTPSLSEGFGLPGIEAMSSGTLVLASNIPVYKEVYKDNAIFFNQLDFTSIESSLKQALSIKGSDRINMINKAKAFAKNYSWSKMAKQTIDIYEKTHSYSLR